MDHDLKFPISAQRLIPHRPPMRLVERLLEIDNDGGVVESVPLSGSESRLFDKRDNAEIPLFGELIAQAYAAIKGYHDLSRGISIQRGFLVGIRKVALMGPIPRYEKLRIRVKTSGEFGGFYLADGEILHEDRLIAAGSIKLWASGAEKETK